MARGKHQKSKQGRDLQDLLDALAAIANELAAEERLHCDTRVAQAETDALKAELAAACKERDRACQAEVGRLTNEIAALEPWVATAREMDRRLDVPWQKMMLPVNDALGGGIEGFEAFMTLLSADNETVVLHGVAPATGMTREKIAALQKARGDRRTARPQQHYNDTQKRMRRTCWHRGYPRTTYVALTMPRSWRAAPDLSTTTPRSRSVRGILLRGSSSRPRSRCPPTYSAWSSTTYTPISLILWRSRVSRREH